jgi:integrase
VGLRLTFYEATRHSFCSRLLAAGVPIDDVSAAMGHSSSLVTKRFYDHHIRKNFAPNMRRGLKAKTG